MAVVRKFLRPGQSLPQLSVDINYLIVGGGGSGGADYQVNSDAWCPGGGGGAGGYVIGNLTLQKDIQYSIIIGGGGSTGSNGTNSNFNSVIACGGGYGNGGNGASGGGGVDVYVNAGTGITGQGNTGGDPDQFQPYVFGGLTGGGGGASQPGLIGSTVNVQPNPNAPDGIVCRRSGDGGNGCQWLDGNRYAGGGGGGTLSPDTNNTIYTSGVGRDGGGGGSKPVNSCNLVGCNGIANTGGGGGGSGTYQADRGIVGTLDRSNGGSGIVAILYCSSTQLLSGGNVTCANGCIIHYYCTSCSISII